MRFWSITRGVKRFLDRDPLAARGSHCLSPQADFWPPSTVRKLRGLRRLLLGVALYCIGLFFAGSIQ